jgi:hypothetical protein
MNSQGRSSEGRSSNQKASEKSRISKAVTDWNANVVQ